MERDYRTYNQQVTQLKEQHAKNASPVYAVLSTLADRQETLSKMLEELTQRLEPILRPLPAEPTTTPPLQPEEVSPLVALLARHAMHADSHCSRLGDLLKRITL